MTAETLTWIAIVAALTATLVFVLLAAPLDVIGRAWDDTFFGPKPRWMHSVKRALDVVLWAVPALFILMFLRAWLG